MQDVQTLRFELIQIIYKLPLDGLRLLTEFAAFVETKFFVPRQDISSDSATHALEITSDEKGLGTEIVQIMAEIGGVELELPKRSMPRPAPTFLAQYQRVKCRINC